MITEKLWRSLIMTTTVIEAHLHPRTSQCRRVCSVPTHAPHTSAFNPIPAGDVDYMVSTFRGFVAHEGTALSEMGLFLNDGTGRFVYTPVGGDPRQQQQQDPRSSSQTPVYSEPLCRAVCCIPGRRHPR